MDIMMILYGITTLLVSLCVGVLVLFWGFRLFCRFTRSIDETRELLNNNIAVALVSGAFIFSLGLVLQSAIDPLVQSFFRMIFYQDQGWGLVLLNLCLLILQFGLSLFLGILVLWAGLKAFSSLTQGIDEFQQIRDNNIAVAILMAVLLVTLALFLQEGMEKLLQVLIVEPQLGNSGITPFG